MFSAESSLGFFRRSLNGTRGLHKQYIQIVLNSLPDGRCIPMAYALLPIKSEEIEDFYICKRETVKTGRGRGVKITTVLKERMFKIELWNVFNRVNDNLPRPNNFVEAWHNAFSSMRNKHPSVYSLVDSLIKEQKRTEKELIKLNTGIFIKEIQNIYF
ncbi:unnamed protein product [Brachionus calyciflorus]|uniref:Uncharacterized protein n=1 Tax=Brachionus calyciflorus TaxID=104777 RepID=A0A814GN01_9BILA|nr:unnamed protein product [Brachionus calyciflorus]